VHSVGFDPKVTIDPKDTCYSKTYHVSSIILYQLLSLAALMNKSDLMEIYRRVDEKVWGFIMR
jgi:hypothetical protein